MKLPVVRLDERARLPERAHEHDAGLDLHALEPLRLAPGERSSVATGLAVEIPPGHAGLILPRSGLAHRHGISVVNAPGLIDAGYRGEIRVLLLNTDRSETFQAPAGARIAQLVIVAIAPAQAVEASELSDSARATGGFGSTGR